MLRALIIHLDRMLEVITVVDHVESNDAVNDPMSETVRVEIILNQKPLLENQQLSSFCDFFESNYEIRSEIGRKILNNEKSSDFCENQLVSDWSLPRLSFFETTTR